MSTVSRLFGTSMIVNVIGVVFRFSYIKYVSYNVDQEIFGKYVLLLTFVAFADLLFYSPVSQAASRLYHDQDKRNFFYSTFLTIISVGTVVSVVALCLIMLVMEDIVWLDMLLLSLFLCAGGIFVFFRSMGIQRLKIKYFVTSHIFENISRFLLPLVFYAWQPSLQGLLFGIVIGYALALLWSSLNYDEKFIYGIGIDQNIGHKVVHFAVPLVFTSIGSWTISFSDRWVISAFLNYEQVGIYAMMSQLASIPLIAGGVLTTFMQPYLFNRAKKDVNAAVEKWRIGLFGSLAVMLFLLLVLYYTPDRVYALIFDTQHFDHVGRSVYIWLAAGSTTLVLCNITSLYFMLLKKVKLLVPLWLIAATVNLIGNLILIPDYGIIAAAVTTSIAYLLVLLLSLGMFGVNRYVILPHSLEKNS
jgi:O-antigen/teichoic acid export membrane protein